MRYSIVIGDLLRRQMLDESMKVALSTEEVQFRSRLVVVVNYIAIRLR